MPRTAQNLMFDPLRKANGTPAQRRFHEHPLKTMRNFATTVIAALAIQAAQAQVTIADGYAATCSGSVLDSGGEGAAGYSDNENYTLILCPDGSGGPAISLQWFTFNLSTAGTQPIDQLAIYDGMIDGVNPDPPLIGVYDGNTPPGIISASFENVQNTLNGGGCLTLVFTSNETGTGVFAAAISCTAPCEPPTAAATTGAALPMLVCQGETITFDGSASTAADPFDLVNYNWNFDDGQADSTTGAVVQHAFDEAGEYVVQLTVTDNNNCTNTNLVDLQIFVSTTPDFTGTVVEPLVICEGESIDLTAVATPVTWSALPSVNLGDGVTMPDGSGVAYSSQLNFTQFSPGATLTDPNDILGICASLEHSYMGDLIISITCPTGQSMTMHQQNGGGTYLGAANDGDAGNAPVIGECWDYCWSPTATLGTFADCAAFGATPNVMMAGTPENNALIPGTYSSVQPWTNLVGCDLNGTWTFTVVDNWAIDNGFLCGWDIDFDPSLFPSLTQFTPVLGTSTPDSAGWVGTGLGQTSGPLVATAIPVGVGTQDYVFSVTDNFGCTYDTTFTILVNPGIPGPITITGNNIICEGAIAYLNAPAGFGTYTWSNGSVGQNISAQEGTYTVTVANGDCSLESEPFTVTSVPRPVPVIDGPGFSCGGEPAVLGTLEPHTTYAWSNGQSTPTITAGTGTYTVTVTNAEGCSGVSQQFVVVVGSDPQAAFSTDPASPQGIGTTVNFADLSQGNGSPIVGWAWAFGMAGATSTDQSPNFTYTTPGEYPISLMVTTADGCEHTINSVFVILPEEIVIPNVFTPNGDGSNEYFVIENGQYYDNTLQIFNRWGQEVFEAKDYRNGWRGNDLPDGTYYYVFTTVRDAKEYTGHVTILR